MTNFIVCSIAFKLVSTEFVFLWLHFIIGAHIESTKSELSNQCKVLPFFEIVTDFFSSFITSNAV